MNSDIVINDSAFNIGQLVKYKGREAAVIDVFWVTLKDTWVYAVEEVEGIEAVLNIPEVELKNK